MLRRGTVIQMIAALALLLGSLPVSAMASLFSRTCSMPCCAGKPAHMMDDPDCAKECDEAVDHHLGHAAPEYDEHALPEQHHLGTLHSHASLSKQHSAGCKCTISSGPSTPNQPAAATSPSSSFSSEINVVLPEQTRLIGALRLEGRTPGIVGADAGPPVEGPKYATLGRAPPVHLA